MFDLVVNAWQATSKNDPTGATLQAVITELDVAASRALFNTGTLQVGQLKDGPGGAGVDTKPVCLSTQERSVILGLGNLPESIRTKLR